MAEVGSRLHKRKINEDHWFSTQISLVSRWKMSQKSMKINGKTWKNMILIDFSIRFNCPSVAQVVGIHRAPTCYHCYWHPACLPTARSRSGSPPVPHLHLAATPPSKALISYEFHWFPLNFIDSGPTFRKIEIFLVVSVAKSIWSYPNRTVDLGSSHKFL